MNQAIHQLDAMISIAGLPARVAGRCAARGIARRSKTTRSRCSSGSRARPVCSSRRSPIRRDTNGWRSSATAAPSARRRLRRHHHRARRRAAAVRRLSRTSIPSSTHEWRTDRDRARALRVARLPRRRASRLRGCGARRPRPLVDCEEGTQAVELANAIYLSSVEGRVVELPLERGEYAPWYEELVAGSLTI